MFPVYGGMCLLRKEVHNGVEKRGRFFADEEEVETEVRKWLRQQSKYLYAVGFDAVGQVSIRREINVFFPGSNITCFTFYIHL
jgi:hypothetical protein